ncbi:MAG: phosphate acyltransferase, partial [Vagococcus sp.]
MELFEGLKHNIIDKNVRIVFPEPTDIRVLGAAVRLKSDNLMEPILIGNAEEIREVASTRGLAIDNLTIIDPKSYADFDKMVTTFVERRKGKATEDQARTILSDENYFGTMLVYMNLADGLVSGAVHSTGDTIRPALQIIKTKPGVSRTSGAFL